MITAKKYLFIIILLLAVCLRLAYVLMYPQLPLLNDPSGYDKTGWELAKNGKGFHVFKIRAQLV